MVEALARLVQANNMRPLAVFFRRDRAVSSIKPGNGRLPLVQDFSMPPR
jgi:hypothetical protein